MRTLLTCPPMLGIQEEFQREFATKGVELYCADVVQTLSEEQLIELVPGFDAWIIGDDPATRAVFEAGAGGRLKAAVKWGVGVDNVDFAAAREFGIEIDNTPQMFGAEVADIAMGYVVGLARQTYLIDRAVRAGDWPKPRGISLRGKHVGLVGYGDIGRHSARRLLAASMRVTVYDPAYADSAADGQVRFANWPEGLGECDFLVLACALNDGNRHMLSVETLAACKHGVRIVNVSRGPVDQ